MITLATTTEGIATTAIITMAKRPARQFFRGDGLRWPRS
jgi:hypothetical protein